MAWTSSTAVVSTVVDGSTGTYSNNALIVGDAWGNFLEVGGTNDTIIGGNGNDSIAAVMYPLLGMNGDYAYINGGAGNDVIGAISMQGEQHATLAGGDGIDTFAFGSDLTSTINVELADFLPGVERARIFYEGYQPGCFTCYTTDKGLLITDNAGRLTVTLDGIYDFNSIADAYIELYPYGYNGAKISNSYVQYVQIGNVVNYGGNLPTGDDATIVIDNTQSAIGSFLVGNAQANFIFAGSGGDTLWGAANDDILIGGAGADNFLYGAGEGADFITNTDALDTVNLYNLRLSDIAVAAEGNTITLAQDSTNAVTIQFNGTLSPAIQLGDGSRYRYDKTNSTWQNA